MSFSAQGLILSLACMASMIAADSFNRWADQAAAEAVARDRAEPRAVTQWKESCDRDGWDCMFNAYENGWRP